MSHLQRSFILKCSLNLSKTVYRRIIIDWSIDDNHDTYKGLTSTTCEHIFFRMMLN